jgi:hypothetical protein
VWGCVRVATLSSDSARAGCMGACDLQRSHQTLHMLDVWMRVGCNPLFMSCGDCIATVIKEGTSCLFWLVCTDNEGMRLIITRNQTVTTNTLFACWDMCTLPRPHQIDCFTITYILGNLSTTTFQETVSPLPFKGLFHHYILRDCFTTIF